MGGCLRAPPVEYGLTEDTGGHITHVLGAALALVRRPDIERVEIATRLIADPRLGTAYARPFEQVAPGVTIRRLDTGNRRYLSKEATTPTGWRSATHSSAISRWRRAGPT